MRKPVKPFLRYTRRFMRRGLAISLAIVFSFLLISPALAGSLRVQMPPCCRKNGKHHCAMQGSMPNGAGQTTGGSLVSPRCPCFPHAAPVSHLASFAAPPRNRAFTSPICEPDGCAQAQAGYRVSSLRSRHKRGPPVFVLS